MAQKGKAGSSRATGGDSIRPLIAGNWKMNGRLPAAMTEFGRLLREVGRAATKAKPAGLPEILVCPPAVLLAPFRDAIAAADLGGVVALGGQDCHPAEAGAHTGDIAAEMLRDAGATHVIVGHSERRADHGEKNATVAAKLAAAHRAGLVPILCVGETLSQRDAGHAPTAVARQVRAALGVGCTAANTVIAYEPVWAIGTGRTPTPEDVAAMHLAIRRTVEKAVGAPRMRILYGGSVKPDNAATLLAVDGVNGALVGGASLLAQDFWGIAKASPKQG